MNVGKCTRVIEDIHSKPAHTVSLSRKCRENCDNFSDLNNICTGEASPHVTRQPSTYDLFLTSATDSCVKLWDLRANMYVFTEFICIIYINFLLYVDAVSGLRVIRIEYTTSGVVCDKFCRLIMNPLTSPFPFV